MDEYVIKLYEEGHSMNYISKLYYRYVKRNNIKFKNDIKFENSTLTLSYCRNYVAKLIYSYILTQQKRTTRPI